MIEWLLTFPNAGIGALVLGVALSVTTIIPTVVRFKFNLNPSEPVSKGAEESFKLFVSLTLLLLAFCLVRVQGDHRSVEDLVAREATTIYKLNRAIGGFGAEEAKALRNGLKQYVVSTVEVEWPLLAKGQRSDVTSALLAALTEGCRELEPKTATQQIARAEILGTLTQMSDLREARLAASHLGLPSYYWQAIGLSMVLLTLFGWLQWPLPKMVVWVGGVTLGVSLLFTILIATSSAFLGEGRVTPEAIVRIIPALGGG